MLQVATLGQIRGACQAFKALGRGVLARYDKPMRVAVMIPYLEGRGGTQRQGLELAASLTEMGHEPHVITALWNRQACFPELTARLNVHAAIEIDAPRHPQGGAFLRLLRGPLRQAARATGAVYGANYRVMRQMTARILALLQRLNRRWDVLNPHDYGVAAWAASELAAKERHAIVWQCNDPLLRWDRPAAGARALRALLLAADRRRVRHIRHVTVLDHRVAAVVQRRYGVVPQVVRSGVDTSRLATLPSAQEARGELGLPPDARVLLVLSLLNSPHRRAEDVIAAHALGPADVYLLLAGTAPEGSDYVARVAASVAASPARQRIVWRRAPLCGDDELCALFAASDVLVFPNVNQTWGLGAIEAAAAGLAVVISDGAGASEVFAHGETAVIYRGGDVQDLASALTRLWADDATRREMAQRGCRMARQTFSWRKYAESMVDVFTRSGS